MTHRERVAARLRAYGSASLAWADANGGIQLRTRVHELRREGWVIDTQPDGMGEGYVLIEAPGEPPRRPGLWS